MGRTGTTISVSEDTRDLIRQHLASAEEHDCYDDLLRTWVEDAQEVADESA